MERLTEFWSGSWILSLKARGAGYDNYSVLSRLSAYEDTGLTPEEITAAADRRHNCKIECLLEKYNKVIEERDTLKKALELMRKYFKKNQIGIDIDYFVQQAQEQEGNHER